MSAYREAWLCCNHHDEPAEGQKWGRSCPAEFRVPADSHLGFVSSYTVLRKWAAKAGWTYVRWPSRTRSLDRDFCPKHKPESEDPQS